MLQRTSSRNIYSQSQITQRPQGRVILAHVAKMPASFLSFIALIQLASRMQILLNNFRSFMLLMRPSIRSWSLLPLLPSFSEFWAMLSKSSVAQVDSWDVRSFRLYGEAVSYCSWKGQEFIDWRSPFYCCDFLRSTDWLLKSAVLNSPDGWGMAGHLPSARDRLL